MKPAEFEYVRPSSTAEACEILSSNPEATVLAGGQSLIPLMNFRLIRPSVLVDLRDIDGLRTISVQDRALTIGSMVTHRNVEQRDTVMKAVSILRDALPLIGHVGIRNMGTVGGSLAHADPAAEWAAVALLLNGLIHTEGVDGSRVIAASDFFVDWMTTALKHDEIIQSVSIDIPDPGTGSAFMELARRQGDFAMAGVGVVLRMQEGLIASADMALLGLGLTPRLCPEASNVLEAKRPTSDVVAEASDVVVSSVAPLDDQHASAEYKRRVSGVLATRAIRLAARRAGHSDAR